MNHGQQNGQTKESSMVALALIVGALLACSMVVLSNTQALCMEANTRPALLLGNESLPPMSFTKLGKPTGIVIDLAEAISKHMHQPVEIRLMNWAEAQQLVLEGRADALLQMDPNPERLKIFDFSETLLTSEFTIFTSFERSGVSSIRDLTGLKVGVEEKGRPILLLKEYPQINLEIIPNFNNGFRMLEDGSLDAVVADRWVGRYVLAENNIQDVNLFDIPILQSQSAIAVKKGNSILLGDINAALLDIRRDGSYDRIIQSWRSKEVVFKTREQLRQQVWLIVAISAALIATLVGIAALAREIRRRKRVEASLLESKEQLRLFIDNAPASMAMFDRQMRYLFVSSRWLNDYNLEDRSLTGLSHYEVFPEIPESWKTVHRRALAGETLKSDSDRFERADGSVQWLRWEVRPWFDHSDNIAGIVIFTEDITESKRAEEAAQAERLLLETVVSCLPTGIDVIRGSDLRIMLVNPAYQAIAPGKEMVGKTLDELWPETQRTFLDLCRHVLATGEPHHAVDELNMVRRFPGEPLESAYFTWSLFRVLLPGKDGWAILNTTLETTDRVMALEALRESEEKFRAIFELSTVGKAQADPSTGRLLLVNDEFCKITGYPREELLQKTFHDITLPDDRTKDNNLIEQARKQGKTSWVSEKRYIRKDGTVVWVVVNGTMLFDRYGRLYRFIAAISDITDRKQAEEQLRASLSEKEVLLKEIHHRVKNNLQVISSLISLQADTLADEQLQAVLSDVRDRVRTMALVHEKLYQTKDMARIDFAEYAPSLLSYLWSAHSTTNTNMRLNMTLAPLILPVETAVNCGLILNELASNAIKHAFPGGSGGEVCVVLEHEPATGAVCLKVRDNGVGLPVNLDWRQSSSLGLRLVHMLAGQMRGSVQKGQGQGTEFQILFNVNGTPL